MNIAIDCRMMDSSGIGVYLRECLPWFLKSDNRFLLFGDAGRIREAAGLSPAGEAPDGDPPKVRVVSCAVPPFSPSELFFFPSSLKKEINRCGLYYSPYFNLPGGIRIPVCTTIHDMVFPDMKECFSGIGIFLRMRFLKRAYRASAKIFTVSCFSRSRIRHYFGAAKPVIVTYSAIQPFLTARRPEKTARKKNIIFIGNIKRHKGLWCLLDAFLMARNEGLGYKLVIVGSMENFRTRDDEIIKKIEALEGGDREAVEFTGFINNEKLRELLSGAALLVQPSLYEGFGLPPLEAMISGTGALISDIPCFREIYEGFPVHFFRAGDRVDLKNRLMELLHKKTPESVSLSPSLASKYRFEKTAAIIQAAWKEG
jgi:glycosyltransferase involved in cell wall biosynthesis